MSFCKNPKCNKEILTFTRLGKIPKHCSVECRYASPRGGKQYIEQPPICFLEECNNDVTWHKEKRIWNKYCCLDCGKIGRSHEVSKTKTEQNLLLPKIDDRQIVKCSVFECQTFTPKRKKKNVLYAYCCDECRGIGLVRNQTQTFREKFGVDRPSQNTYIFEKSQKNGKKLRKYIFKSGDEVSVRGYEPKALRLLESEGYTKNDIVVSSKEMPKIWYEQNGRHRYHPDIFISDENLIIEVKSTFTYNIELEKNLLKQQACLDAGYNFKFMIFDKDGTLLDDK